ncbi:MAG: hypothetical protein KGJ80_09700 [Chloroflexota bacterium]|nr:hypothetical protein [Chloroflexota bacterium]
MSEEIGLEEAVEIEAHNARVAELVAEIGRAFAALMRVLVELGLTIILQILRALPYLLRVASVLLWAVSMYAAFLQVFRLYILFSDLVVSILSGMVAAFLVLLIPTAFFAHAKGGEIIWGGYFFSALVGFGLSELARRVAEQSSLYPLASVTPPALAAVCLILVVVVHQKEGQDEQSSFERTQGTEETNGRRAVESDGDDGRAVSHHGMANG